MQPPPSTPQPGDGDPTIGMDAVRPPPQGSPQQPGPPGSSAGAQPPPAAPPPGRPQQTYQQRPQPQGTYGPQGAYGQSRGAYGHPQGAASQPGPQVVQGVVEPAGAVRTPFFARRPAVVTPPGATRLEFGNPIGYTLARLCAFALDIGEVTMVVTVLAYALIAINPITGLPTNTQRGFDWTLAIGAAIALFYVWIAEALFGTTIWKLALGLHVYAQRERVVGLGRSFVRGLLRPIDLLLVGGVLSLLPGHRRLGDLLGGTIVARTSNRYAPLIGLVCAIVLAGIPFVVIGAPLTFRGIIAFWEFFPGIVARVALWIARGTAFIPH